MSVTSMTGFGSAIFSVEGQGYRVEMKSVNHKTMNVRFRAPSEFNAVEAAGIKLVRETLRRGAVDVSINREAGAKAPIQVVVDRHGLAQMMRTLQDLASELAAPSPSIESALRQGDFVEVQAKRSEPEVLLEGLSTGLKAAMAVLTTMREKEGERLAEDLQARIATLEGLLETIEGEAPKVYEAYEERLRKRLADAQERLGIPLDEGRVATELVMFADRSDVTEEIVRARTHLARFREILGSGAAETGKRLDFLAQELGREFNTIGSKCRDAGMADAVVSTKVELEKIREQVQNIA